MGNETKGSSVFMKATTATSNEKDTRAVATPVPKMKCT